MSIDTLFSFIQPVSGTNNKKLKLSQLTQTRVDEVIPFYEPLFSVSYDQVSQIKCHTVATSDCKHCLIGNRFSSRLLHQNLVKLVNSVQWRSCQVIYLSNCGWVFRNWSKLIHLRPKFTWCHQPAAGRKAIIPFPIDERLHQLIDLCQTFLNTATRM